MGVEEQAIRLALSVSGQETITALETAVSSAELGILELADAFVRGDVDAATYEKSLSRQSGELAKLTQLLEGFKAEVAETAAANAAAAAAQAELATRSTAATEAWAAQTQAVSGWGAVMASANETGEQAAAVIREKAAADEQAVSAANALIGSMVVEAEAAEADARALMDAKIATSLLANSTQTMVAAGYEMVGAYELVEQEERKVTVQTRALSDALRETYSGIQVSTADVNRFAMSMAHTGDATRLMAHGTGNLQMQIQAASFAFQDFTSVSGDLGMKMNSISNNIPMILSGLGAWGIAASVAATGGIAVYRSWDQVALLWRDRNPFLEAAKSVEEMTKALEKDKDELEKLHTAASITEGDLKREAELTREIARAEAERDAARSEQQTRKTRSREQDTRASEFDKISKEFGGEQTYKDIKQIITESAPKGSLSPEAIEQQTRGFIANLKAGYSDARMALEQLVIGGAGQKTGVGQAVMNGGLPSEIEATRAKKAAADLKSADEADKKRKAKQKKSDAEEDFIVYGFDADAESAVAALDRDKMTEQQKLQADIKAQKEEDARKAKARFSQQVKETIDKVSGTALPGQAAGAAAQARAQGGDENEQFIILAKQIEGILRREMRGVRPEVIREAAVKLAQQAGAQAETMVPAGPAAPDRVPLRNKASTIEGRVEAVKQRREEQEAARNARAKKNLPRPAAGAFRKPVQTADQKRAEGQRLVREQQERAKQQQDELRAIRLKKKPQPTQGFRGLPETTSTNALSNSLSVAQQGTATTSATLDTTETLVQAQERQKARDQTNAARAQQLSQRARRLLT